MIHRGDMLTWLQALPDGSPRPHQGWDLVAEPGTPCYAVADGVIETVNGLPTDTRGYGLTVILRLAQPAGEVTHVAYCHLSRADVKPGQAVTEGAQIGLTGNSGNAVGMRGEDQHLHIEARTRQPVSLGLDGRVSPLRLFGRVPWQEIRA